MAEATAEDFRPDVALRRLRGDARRLWREASARAAALDDLLAAWDRQDTPALHRAIGRIDASVVAGLRVVGLPRGPIAGITLDVFGRGWRGRKLPVCMLCLDAFLIDRCVRLYQAPDDVFRTWLHESIHARQPFAPSFREESRLAAGYEEGLAEGLARWLMRAQPGMRLVEHSYGQYVAAYEALAASLGCPADVLWRRLWSVPAGAVRQGFLDVVDEVRLAATGQRLSQRQRILMRSRADTVFRTVQALTGPIEPDQLRDGWERALQ